MRSIDAKRYLQQVKQCDMRIRIMMEELERMKSFTEKVTSTLSDISVSGTKNNDKMGDAVVKIVELRNEINSEIDRFIDLKMEVIAVLDDVANEDQYAVLYKRYVQFKTFEKIACEMNMTYRNVCYIHGRALQAVERILRMEDNSATD